MRKITTYVLTIFLIAALLFTPQAAEAKTHQKSNITYVVTGQAKIWEATYSYRVKAGKKELVSGYGTASMGAPEWGDFKEQITVKKQKGLTLELFEISQENGKEINKLIISLDNTKGKTYHNKVFRQVKVTVK